jgi:hypothetical protein
MNFFSIKTSWSNAEFIPLKVCIGTAYLLIGTYFPTFFGQYLVFIWGLFVITMIWSLTLWLTKMKPRHRRVTAA